MEKKKEQEVKETKYCRLLQSVGFEDKYTGYKYAIEKIYVKSLKREEIRICLYKDMRDRAGQVANKMLVRPVDLTSDELLKLLVKGYQDGILDTDFIKTFISQTIEKK